MVNKLDTVENKSRYSLSYIIKKAAETLYLKTANKSLNRKFPILYQYLSKDHLVITYSLITTYYNRLSFTSLALKIANSILFSIYYNEIIKINIGNDCTSFEEFQLNLEVDKLLKLKLGSYFIEIFCSKPTFLFERSYKSDAYSDSDSEVNDNDLAVLVVNEEYFESLNNNFFIHPASLPMLCQPNKWSENEYGGYLNNTIEKNNIITGSVNHKHLVENKDKLYNAINRINSVKFKINKQLLDYLESDGKYLLDSYFKTLKNDSDRLQSNITLKIAKSFSNLQSPFSI